MTDAIHYQKDQDQIVTLTIDMPGQNANTMNAVYRQAMAETVIRLQEEKDTIAGVIITSGKKTFCRRGSQRTDPGREGSDAVVPGLGVAPQGAVARARNLRQAGGRCH